MVRQPGLACLSNLSKDTEDMSALNEANYLSAGLDERISLYLTEGSSDKEYHAQLVAADDGYCVNFQYGRRGSSLTSGTKTKAPVDYPVAKAAYDKLVKEKMAKGYSTGLAGEAFQNPLMEQRASGVLPQLLNAITESQALALLEDDDYLLEEKFDGHRRMTWGKSDGVIGVNKKGLAVALPLNLAQAVEQTPEGTLIDGELMGGVLYAFDLLSLGQEDLRNVDAQTRHERLIKLLADTPATAGVIKVAKAFHTTETKRAEFERIKAAKGEGVVFKLKNSAYAAGRPNSGGSQLKFKFKEEATLQVSAVSATKRSVSLQGYADDGVVAALGNVTIPEKFAIPQVGAIVEVQYLYAFPGGALCQPVYKGPRDDQDVSDCKLSQLKIKPADASGEEGDEDSEG